MAGRGILVVLGAVVLMAAMQQLSGDPANLLLPVTATEEQRLGLRQSLGLDRPAYQRIATTAGRLITGDLGASYRENRPVAHVLARTAPNTFLLAGLASSLALVVGLPVGLLASRLEGRAVDWGARGLAFIGQAVPSFWLAILAIWLFSVQLGWLPTSGIGGWRHLVMPTLALALFPLGQIVRLVRDQSVGLQREEFVLAARSRGCRSAEVYARHILPHVLISVLTAAGYIFTTLMGGAIVTEVVFGWPGLGQLIVASIGSRDYPVVQGAALLIAVAVAVTYMAIDLISATIDPRIRRSPT